MAEMKTLEDQCLLLPKKGKQHLIKILRESIAEEERECEKRRFALLYKAATDVCGNGILGKLRNRELVIGRMMIAYKMKQEGCSLSAIARCLNKNHSSVYHYSLMMQDVLDFQFQEEMAYWNKFIEKVKEYEKELSSEVV